MDDLCSHGWKLEAAKESEDIDEVDMKELFIEADIARRNSVELLVTPAPKVIIIILEFSTAIAS